MSILLPQHQCYHLKSTIPTPKLNIYKHNGNYPLVYTLQILLVDVTQPEGIFEDTASLYGSLDILRMSGYVSLGMGVHGVHVKLYPTEPPHSQNTNESWHVQCHDSLVAIRDMRWEVA